MNIELIFPEKFYQGEELVAILQMHLILRMHLSFPKSQLAENLLCQINIERFFEKFHLGEELVAVLPMHLRFPKSQLAPKGAVPNRFRAIFLKNFTRARS